MLLHALHHPVGVVSGLSEKNNLVAVALTDVPQLGSNDCYRAAVLPAWRARARGDTVREHAEAGTHRHPSTSMRAGAGREQGWQGTHQHLSHRGTSEKVARRQSHRGWGQGLSVAHGAAGGTVASLGVVGETDLEGRRGNEIKCRCQERNEAAGVLVGDAQGPVMLNFFANTLFLPGLHIT